MDDHFDTAIQGIQGRPDAIDQKGHIIVDYIDDCEPGGPRVTRIMGIEDPDLGRANLASLQELPHRCHDGEQTFRCPRHQILGRYAAVEACDKVVAERQTIFRRIGHCRGQCSDPFHDIGLVAGGMDIRHRALRSEASW